MERSDCSGLWMDSREKLGLFVVVILLFPLLNWTSLCHYTSFLDGITYGAISRNWAVGEGSPWILHYSRYLYPEFYEHPPLFFWIEGGFFYLFGDHKWITEINMTLIWICTIGTFVFSGSKKKPIKILIGTVIFLLLPYVYWSFQNNMLDPLLGLFILTAILSFQRGLKAKGKTSIFYVLSAFLSACAICTKGVVAFPVLIWPIISLLTVEKVKLKNVAIFYSVILAISLIIWSLPEAQLFWKTYFDKQVFGSTGQGLIEFESLPKRLLEILFPAILIIGITYSFLKLSIVTWNKQAGDIAWYLIIIMFIFPWIIFNKFNPHYLYVPTLILWYFIYQRIEFKEMNIPKFIYPLVLISAFCLGIILQPQEKVQFLLMDKLELENNQILKVNYTLCSDWYLYAVMQRCKSIDVRCLKNGFIDIYKKGDNVNCLNKNLFRDYIICK